MNKKSILQISTTPLQYDGLTKVIFSLIENSNADEYEITVLATRGGKDVFFKRLEAMGVRCLLNVNRGGGVVSYYKSLLALLKTEKYDVVHVHGNSATMAIELAAAKSAGVPVRISHGHNTRTNHPAVHALLKPILNSAVTSPCACGRLAGEFLYGKREFTIIPNCIDTEKFCYDDEIRSKTRVELGLKDELLIGHIGRFSYQKNHDFLIDIFEEVVKIRPDARLLLVGEGELYNEVLSKVKSHGLSEKVIFYGPTDKIAPLLMAFDVFLLPSRFEGLSITAIEAQCAGLKLITSDATTRETDVSGNCIFLSLNEAPGQWAGTVVEAAQNTGITDEAVKSSGTGDTDDTKASGEIADTSEDRKNAGKAVGDAGYDIKSLPEKIRKIWG